MVPGLGQDDHRNQCVARVGCFYFLGLSFLGWNRVNHFQYPAFWILPVSGLRVERCFGRSWKPISPILKMGKLKQEWGRSDMARLSVVLECLPGSPECSHPLFIPVL